MPTRDEFMDTLTLVTAFIVLGLSVLAMVSIPFWHF